MVFEQVREEIRKAAQVDLSSHEHADGDSIGSLLGMAIVLRDAGKRVTAALPNAQRVPPQYRFLPGVESLGGSAEVSDFPDLFIALDCGNIDRLGDLKEKATRARLLVNIDHHEDNNFFGHLNLVFREYSSTSELVLYLLREEYEISERAATCLYVGLVTDTGRFKHNNTTARSFLSAAELLSLGAKPEETINQVYENASLGYMKLMGIMLERVQRTEGFPLVYSFITQEDLERTGVTMEETEDLIEMLRIARGAKAVMLLKEQPDGKIRASLRSRDEVEVGKVARLFGGGGHAQAAGFTSSQDKYDIVEMVKRALVDQAHETR